MAEAFQFICNSCDETIESWDEAEPATTPNASTRGPGYLSPMEFEKRFIDELTLQN
jgi:hypothetical protein